MLANSLYQAQHLPSYSPLLENQVHEKYIVVMWYR